MIDIEIKFFLHTMTTIDPYSNSIGYEIALIDKIVNEEYQPDIWELHLFKECNGATMDELKARKQHLLSQLGK